MLGQKYSENEQTNIVFFAKNELKNKFRDSVTDLNVYYSKNEIEDIMYKFINNEFNVLLCLNVPNVTPPTVNSINGASTIVLYIGKVEPETSPPKVLFLGGSLLPLSFFKFGSFNASVIVNYMPFACLIQNPVIALLKEYIELPFFLKKFLFFIFNHPFH